MDYITYRAIFRGDYTAIDQDPQNLPTFQLIYHDEQDAKQQGIGKRHDGHARERQGLHIVQQGRFDKGSQRGSRLPKGAFTSSL